MEGVLALIPAYEEGPRIAAVVARTRAHLPVVVVDDGSSDDTAAQAEAAGATVLRQTPNAGKGAALRAGFRHALERGAPAVVTLDADGQHDPDEIPRFLAAFETSPRGAAQAGPPTAQARPPAAQTGPRAARAGPPELVVGCRDFADMPPLRRMSNTLGTWIFSAAVGRRVADNQSGYRLIARRLMGVLLDSHESGFEFEVEMIARCIALGLPIAEVPISTIYAGEPSHIRNWQHVTHFLRVSYKAGVIVRGGR